MLRAQSSTPQMNVMPDGGETTVLYNDGYPGNRWPGKTEVTVMTQLSGRSLDLKITARNTGKEPVPVGIGWAPRFAALNEGRSQLMLHVPSATRLEKNQRTGEPTGKLLAVTSTPYDFSARTGAAIGSLALDDTFANLHQAPLDDGPVVELRDPAKGYGLRMTLISPTIRALHVSSPAGSQFITLAPRFNYDAPFGRQWGHETDAGMVVLQPGQTTQWNLRLEIFSLTPSRL